MVLVPGIKENNSKVLPIFFFILCLYLFDQTTDPRFPTLHKLKKNKKIKKLKKISYDWKRRQSSLPRLRHEIQTTMPNGSLLETFFFGGKALLQNLA